MRNSVRLLFSELIGRLGRRLMGLLLVLLCACTGAWAAVTVTAGTGGTGICSNKAVSGPAPAFTSLGPIVVSEVLNGDFASGTGTIVLNAPSGWQFSGTLPTLVYATGSNITGIAGTISSTTLTVNITVSSTSGLDQFTVLGLQVQPVTTSAPAGNIYATSVSGISGVAMGTSGTNFAPLSVTAPVTASVSITASPSGAFCPGTNILFTPVPVNAGTPIYTWAVNGADVATGSSFSTSSLLNGNTVSCRMLSSVGCLTGNPVYSNTITATVLAAPAAITGSNTVCPGNTITQASSTGGGVWSSSNTAVGTISSGGVLMGIAAGTTTVSYTAGGCSATRTVFVNNPPLAPVLTPTATAMCNATTMSVTATGTAASPNILIQNFNSGLGAWTVDTFGSVNIVSGAEWKACADSYLNEQGWYRSPDFSTFVMANADTSGSSSTLSTRLTSPSFSLVAYTSATLSFQHAYDYWPAGDVFVNLEISTNGGATWSTIVNFRGANIGSKMGFVSQSYSLNAYLGNPNVKIRFLYHSSFGYYWAIDNIVITGTPGVVTPTWSPTTYLYTNAAHTIPYTGGAASTVYVYPTGVSAPTPITYTATAASGTCSTTATSTVTINPSPGTITGALNVCVATSSTLGNAALGGTWVSGNTDIATIGSGTGIVTGVAPGTATITYMLGSSCTATAVVTVNITPAPITGNQNVCFGYSSILLDASTGGVWSSDNTAIAPVNMTTGEVYGLALGTATITYSLGTGCEVTKTVTVQPLPAAVTGPAVVCASQNITLANSTGGGTWVSSNAALGSVGSTSGVVTGVAAGTVNISYQLTTTGCFAFKNVTVNPQGPITGPASVCVGHFATLLNTEAGGTWTSGNTAVATIHPGTGFVSATAVGTSNITYALPTGCTSYRELTVDPIPADISGPAAVCLNSSMTLSNSTPGGSWSSSNTAIVSVGSSSGEVTGNATGTAVISYTISTGCFKATTITVLPVPAPITGTAAVCEAGATVLSCATTGGSWSSSNSNATVAGGAVSGITAGTVNITYTIPNTCFAIRNVTVNPLPPGITGPLAVCQLQSSTLTNTSAGGSWSSGNTVVATIGSATGVMVGGVSGTATIIYTLPTGCLTTAVATVNTLPGSLTGPSAVCTGTSVVLTSSTPGGSWSSSNALASVVAGTVTGVSAGTVNITYTLPTTCAVVKAMTVNLSPAAITGATSVCEGLTTTLTSTTPGGGWSSGNTSIANVGPVSGLVTGIDAGTTTITYMVVTGCVATTTVNVLPVPSAILGNTNVCPGTSSALNNLTSGGTWSSSNTAFITAGSTSGIITGGLSGTATVSYTLPTGCYTVTPAVTNILPADITGAATVCVDASVIYSDVTPLGTWSSSNTAIALAGSSSGIITGVAAGTAVISYTLPTGCAVGKIITVNSLPTPIAGPDNICQNATQTMSSSPSGGLWSSSFPLVGTIGALSGDLYGVAGGTTTISYTLATGCRITKQMTVTALPMPISGAGGVCAGSSILLSDATPGGSWISGNTAVGTVSGAGLFTGIVPGTSIVTYILPLGCAVFKLVSVNPIPATITGNTSLCIGVPSTLSCTTPSGVWTSGNATVASVGPSSGVVNGFVLNTATISYILPTGCFRTTQVTVNFTPAAISGSNILCQDAVTLWTDPSPGGTWSSSNAAIATVGSGSGVVSAIAPGTATISYTAFSGCHAVRGLTVNPLPADILGPSGVCAGYSITMGNTTTGGTWSSSNTSVATVGMTSGVVLGGTAGTTNISYILPTGCTKMATVTVHPLPSSISGPSTVCLSSTIVLSTSTGGGTWTSSNATIAPVAGSGIVTGGALGTAIITYTLGAGCFITKSITVNPLPAAVMGNVPTCPGVSIVLTNPSGTGAWSSTTSAGVATITTLTGVVSPLSAGTAVITYTLPTGCRTFATVTVNAVAPIIGPATICMGVPTTYSHSVTGGTWGSSNALVAGIGASSGLAVGFAANTVTLSYTLPGGCIATRQIAINPVPAAILGTASVCPGLTTALSSATPGGAWSSSNTFVAIVGSSSGIVTGVTSGIVTIKYELPTGCNVTRLLTVNAAPAPITGSATVCTGTATTLAIAATGGTWSSANTAVGTVNSTTGVVSGIAAGTTIISYIPTAGCASTQIVTVYTMPGPIAGVNVICNGTSSILGNLITGGSWSSNNASVATVDGGGVMNGVNPGTAVISYTTAGGCTVTKNATVNVMPDAIGGVPSVCVGYTTLLTSAPTGGTWTSGSTTIATVPSGVGMVGGVAAGTTNITYRLASGCRVMATVTVSASPGVITGATSVCEGANTTLTDPLSGGGTWSSSNTAVATIGSLTGILTGGAAGTTTITYTIGAGCISTATFTVNPVPVAITGIANACIGMTTTLNTITTGGTWSSGNATIATVGTGSGIVNGVAAGTAYIYYTLPTSCQAAYLVTVNPAPGAISGTAEVCVNSTTALGNSVPGGSWSSSNAGVGTVNATTGMVTGIGAGTTMVTYTLGAGCAAVKEVTVDPLPVAITGTFTVCNGQTTTLADATSGGSWSVGTGGVASIGATSGVVTGLAAGTMQIIYTLPTGCATNATVTVHPLAANTGGTLACVGFTTTLANAVSGGIWSSSNTAVATVISGTGLVMGVAPGTSVISYLLPTGCVATSIVTVTSVSSVTGGAGVCRGQTTTLGNPVAGGVWSSANTSIATVDASGGVVAGILPGTVNISYTYGPGCVSVVVATVHPLSAITGSGSVCAGQSITLSNPIPGGAWSTASSVATVDAVSGVVAGVSGGNALISYSLPTGCVATKMVSVNPLLPITGASSVCMGLTTTLSNAVEGGTWSSVNTGVASIHPSTGVVTSGSVGTTTISYTVSTGCNSSFIVTVFPLPAAITGANEVCEAASIALNSATTGGSWSSSAASASIGSTTGVVNGVAAGTSVISYILPTGCYQTKTISVNPLPPAISGVMQVCAGATTVLSNSVSGGAWTSGSSSIAIINPSSGVVNGVVAGTSVITYTLPTTCATTTIVTVNALPDNIGAPTTICAGATVLFASTTAGGTWSSAHATVSVGSVSGLVTGVSPGTARITYTLPTGCYRTHTVTVFAPPSVITGPTEVCVAATITFSNTTTGGTWTSANTTVATINPVSGIVSGVAAGTALISYSQATGCSATYIITVNPLPAPLTGGTAICAGSASVLSSASAGGVWSSSAPSTASVDAMGVVSGLAAGGAIITYTLPTSCRATANVTVNPLPGVITGATTVCAGSVTNLSSATSGGTWTSSTPSVASVVASGAVLGEAPGTAGITYMLATGCQRAVTVTVNLTPVMIAGPSAVCKGSSIILSNATPGGVWSSGIPGIASITSGGVVNGVFAGTSVISYTLSSTGCRATLTLTVNPLPPGIEGIAALCPGTSTTLTNSAPGGSWATTSAAITVNSTTGLVTGVAPGFGVVTYTLPTGCNTAGTVVVNALPASITGTAVVCEGGATTLSSASTGGSWVSAMPSVATVNSSGVVGGVLAGVVTVSYILPTGCSTSRNVTVNALPAVIIGATSACLGSSTVLINSTPGGTWASGNLAIATVGLTSGVVNGVALGTANVTYTLPTGCRRSAEITVNPLPLPITGTGIICQGAATTLFDVTPGGTWSSGNTTVATASGAVGAVTGVGAGTATISYTLPTGCSAATVITVNALQPITGVNSFCAGDTTTFGNAVPGGTWSSSTYSVTTINAAGIATGVAAGIALISYSLPSGCITSKAVSVNPLPVAFFVTGGGTFCTGTPVAPIGLTGSVSGVTYNLYNGTTLAGTMSGSGSTLSFGAYTVAGSYTVKAINPVTGCVRNMVGVATVNPVAISPAGVSIFQPLGDTVCNGTSIALMAVPVMGGSAPVYTWRVNGTVVSTAATYAYVPTDGDVITCELTSSSPCAVPNTASSGVTMAVLSTVYPGVSISASDNNVCASTPVTFAPIAVNGGAAPIFSWVVNGVVSHMGTTYTYAPADNDMVKCIMTSNARCRNTDSVTSSEVVMEVLPAVIPAVTINANPGFNVVPGTAITFSSITANAGAAPSYQWKINGAAITGATNSSFTWSTFAGGEAVSCHVTSSGECGGYTSADTGIVTFSTGMSATAGSIRLGVYPNPNNGDFVLKGQLGSGRNSNFSMRITNVLGQELLWRSGKAVNGGVNERIITDREFANGMYMLTMQTEEGAQYVLHFVIER